MPDTITIEVDAQTAKAYSAAREDEQKKIRALLRLWLRDLTLKDAPSLSQVMDEAAQNAKARGLTPEILDSLLREI